jgi:eukaryotic-like serine/threonine-protein kinase
MSQPAADRNLLFGILALQMDFITRNALIAAMNAWAVDKSKPLGQILEDQGELPASRRSLLEPLVDEHVRAHGGDPARSLAAIGTVGSAIEPLKQLADTDIQVSLAHAGATRFPDAAHATLAPNDEGESVTRVRYRRLRPHARGGLGEVFVALDSELNREVALKEIQEQHADRPASRARFLLEAEVTSGLEHPGIVPVYGLGQYADGRPFYAMRFIKGDSLKDAIARFHAAEAPGRDPGERGLSLQKLLRRFLDVCNAIAYTHSRGVLHRDLKPDNIMIGKYGETLVVDWGLAKVTGKSGGDDGDTPPESVLTPASGSVVEATQQGSAIGTPGYMPPEQAAGRLDLLGPASDVYSLGATLYALLAGKAPFVGSDVMEILSKVQRGEHARPCESSPWLDPALEAVCLKAIALRSEDRYPTPRALADDVERWLADEPVTAMCEPFLERARRWARRRRTLVTAAAATLVMAAVGLGGVSVVQTKARHDLAAKNIALDQQRRRAEAREQLAIDAVKKFRDAVQANPDLKRRPELDVLRKALLKEPLEFFQRLRDQLQADRSTRLEVLAKLAGANLV